jgi:TnpA family transposase
MASEQQEALNVIEQWNSVNGFIMFLCNGRV